MSKTYSSKRKPRNNWFSRQWYRWLEVFTIRLLFPVALIYLLSNFFKFIKERKIIKKTLLSSQELVDELDQNGFYLDIKNFYLFKFRTYALDNIQILTEQINNTENVHSETVTRLIISNVNELMKSKGKAILDNTSMRILQPSDKVLLIRLHPTSLKPTIVSLKDLLYSLAVFGIFIGSYFLLDYFIF